MSADVVGLPAVTCSPDDKRMTKDEGGPAAWDSPGNESAKGGQVRYTATYVDLRGSIRSAGTFASEKAADQAWQKNRG